MKAILAVFLALAVALGAAAMTERAAIEGEKPGAAGNALGLRVLAALSDGEHNQCVSPVSLGYALSMAALGAEGETARELLDALGLSDPAAMADWIEPLSRSGLKCANAAFIREDLPVRRDYIDRLSERFAAELFPLNAADRVNAWVDAKTDHLIPQLVDDIDPNTRLMLVNAVAMDAEWALSFDPNATGEDVFHAPAGDVQAQFMRATFKIGYGENGLGQFARLDYRDSGLYMLAILPEEGMLDAALEALAEDMDAAIPEMSEQKVRLSLPKLDVSASNGLADALRAQGIRAAFSDAADLSGISDEPLYVSDVLQKARVQIDEDGTRAAAATAVMVANKAMPAVETPPVEMNVNRPWLLLIADEATGAVCFAGVVCDPTQK